MKRFKPSKASVAIALGLVCVAYTHVSLGQTALVNVDLGKQLYVGDNTALDRNKFFNIQVPESLGLVSKICFTLKMNLMLSMAAYFGGLWP